MSLRSKRGIVNWNSILTLDLLRRVVHDDVGQLYCLELAVDQLELFAQTNLHLTKILNVRVFEHEADEHRLNAEHFYHGTPDVVHTVEVGVVGSNRRRLQYVIELIEVSKAERQIKIVALVFHLRQTERTSAMLIKMK